MAKLIVQGEGRASGTSTAQAVGRVIHTETWAASVSAGLGALATPNTTTTVVQHHVNHVSIGQVTGDLTIGSSDPDAKKTPMHPYFNWLLIAVFAIFVLAIVGSGYIAFLIDQPTETQKTWMQAMTYIATAAASGIIGFFGGRFAP